MEDDMDISPTHHICQRIISNGECVDMGFPFTCYSAKGSRFPIILSPHRTPLITSGWFRKLYTFPKVCAADSVGSTPIPAGGNSVEETNIKDGMQKDSGAKEGEKLDSDPNVHPMVLLARAYIEKESGMERVGMIFKKNFKGESAPEMQYIKVALVQTFAVTFFLKYVPAYRFHKEEFIREHRTTVFRTHLEAVRRMQDQVSLKAALEGVSFASKITIFSAGFLFTAQAIASYRNKTSFIEYSIAAGIAGGLARIHFGLRGLVAGSLVGTTLGTLVGGIAYIALSSLGITQEIRHLHEILEMLEVERHLTGEDAFRKRVQELKKMDHTPSVS